MYIKKEIIKLLFVLIVPFSLSATELDYSVGLTVSKYDNLNLEPNPTQGGVSESIVGGIILAEDTANLVANIDASLQLINYDDNQTQDESIGHLVANALWVLSPGHYEWFFSDTYTQTLVDSFDGDTPANRQNVNAFSTGPNIAFKIDSTNNFNIEARVETISFENNQSVIDADNDRVELTAG